MYHSSPLNCVLSQLEVLELPEYRTKTSHQPMSPTFRVKYKNVKCRFLGHIDPWRVKAFIVWLEENQTLSLEVWPKKLSLFMGL